MILETLKEWAKGLLDTAFGLTALLAITIGAVWLLGILARLVG